MGETAENVAKQWNIGRQEQDEFALQSQEKYFAALDKGIWKQEISGVEILGGKMKVKRFTSKQMSHPVRPLSKNWPRLRPAFIKDGSVTAGNSSGINDGAAALLLASEEAVKKYNLKPLAHHPLYGHCRGRSCYHGYWPGAGFPKSPAACRYHCQRPRPDRAQ